MLQTEYVKSLTFGLNLSHRTSSVKDAYFKKKKKKAYFSVLILSQRTSK